MCSLAQEDTLATSIKIKLPTSILKKKAIVNEIEIPLISKKESLTIIPKVNIKADYWNTTVYSPYRNTITEFPLEITFKDSIYTSPVAHKKVITSRYGWRKGRPHKGIDIDLVTGDSVVSILSGIVRFARYSRGHGKTGNSRGSHLHLVASYKGEYIHPDYLFNFDSSNTIRSEDIWVTRKWTRPSYHSSKRLSKLNLFETKEAALASIEKQRKVYVVKSGDTLSRISLRNNTTISSICRTNKIKKTSTLRIGQKLVLEL